MSMQSTSVTSKEHGTILPSLTNKQSPAAINMTSNQFTKKNKFSSAVDIIGDG